MRSWLAARDPGWFALRRATRATVVVGANFAIGSQLIGNAQVATFAAFGTFSILLFANIGGGPATRAFGYVTLAVAGTALISLGTEVATPNWLAVAAMAVVAFVVLFAGVVSSLANGAAQATLLTFILAVMLPGGRAALPDRLAGWGIAVAVAVPVAVFIWPPRDEDQLRLRAARLARALADVSALEVPALASGDVFLAMRESVRELRATFHNSATRTAGLSTGARLLIRLVSELDLLANTVANACADAPDTWPEQGRRLRNSAERVLRASADALDHTGGDSDREASLQLEACLAELAGARAAVAEETLAELREHSARTGDELARGEFQRPLYAAHELGYVVATVGRTVALIAAADSRSPWARMLGRRVTEDELGVITVAQRAAAGQLDRHGVWLQNSVRGAAGLALAVLLSRVFDAQNAFWIGLGALSVLRSTAFATGSTIVRALFGTALGFAIGGSLVAAIGTSHAVLWPILPAAIFIAAYAPNVISFAAGQAAFTMLVIILFNIIAPAGWRVGVVRIEDVGLGCAASLVAGVLFWPRGAGAALATAVGEAYRSAAKYLRQSIEYATGRRADPPDLGRDAMAAGRRLDDALRQYLGEQGTKRVSLESVVTLANGAARVRLAGTAIKHLQLEAPGRRLVPDGDRSLDAPADVLFRRGRDVTGWYDMLADAVERSGGSLPPPSDGAAESFLDVVLPTLDGCGDLDRAARAERLLWSGQYLGDADQLRGNLVEPAGQIAAARAVPWWHR